MNGANDPQAGEANEWFTATQWSLVRNAGHEATQVARNALEQLCLVYWPPIYAYVRRKASTLKRGAGQVPLVLDTVLAEHCDHAQSGLADAPERLFDRQWAETTLERAATRLRTEFMQNGREPLFRELNRFLSMPAEAGDYSAVAARLNLTEAAVAKSVERLRSGLSTRPPDAVRPG